MQKKILIIDGDGLLVPAHYGSGANYLLGTQQVGGVHCAISKIRTMIDTWNADAFQIAFDPFEKTSFRYKEYAAYKANRPPKDEDLVKAKPLLISILKDMGAVIVMNDNYEADDLMATAAMKAIKNNWLAIVGTRDKDLCSLLVHDKIIIQPPFETFQMNKEYLWDRYNIHPEQVNDFLALWGDSADNIPGIDGCGEARSAQLLHKYGTIEGILDAALNGIIKNKLGENIKKTAKHAIAFRKLLTLRTDIENVPSPEESQFGVPNYNNLYQTFTRLTFFDLAKEAKSYI